MADDSHAPLGQSWARRSRTNCLLWLAGDHHIHTQHSSDAQYRMIDQVRHANAYGLGWMVITDYSFLDPAVDPAGTAMDVPGSADPWTDLWFWSMAWLAPSPVLHQPDLGRPWPMTTTAVGFDLGHRDTVAAKHCLTSQPMLGVAGLVACTHLVRGPDPRVVLAVAGALCPAPEASALIDGLVAG